MAKAALSTHLINDSLWQPLVRIDSHRHGLLIQDRHTEPTELQTGWHWHWPLLTTIRAISTEPHDYPINNSIKVSPMVIGDEPIIAVTKDLKLVAIEAELTLQIDGQTSRRDLAKLNKHSINRLIRPIIRQSFRLTVASYKSQALHPTAKLDKQTASLLAPTLADQAISLNNLHIVNIAPFNPLQTALPSGQAR